jgi:hypothetical protein
VVIVFIVFPPERASEPPKGPLLTDPIYRRHRGGELVEDITNAQKQSAMSPPSHREERRDGTDSVSMERIDS